MPNHHPPSDHYPRALIIYYKPRPRNYRVLHRALYNPRPQAEGCMRGVKPDNFEAEACNIFKFFRVFRLLSPVIEVLSKVFFSKKKKLWREKSRSLALLLQLGRRLWRQVALRDEVWPTEACTTTLSRHWSSLSLSLARSLSFFLSKKKEVWRIDRVLFFLLLGLVKTGRGRAPRWNVLNQGVHLKKACTVGVGVADPGARSRSRTGSGWWHGALPYFFDEKEVLSWLHCTCNRKNCHKRQNGCGR